MSVPPVFDFSPEFRSPTISSAADAASDDLVLPLLAILLSGLALVLAWLSAASGGLSTFWQRSRPQQQPPQQQQPQRQQLSSRLYQDNRPIAVFVFENFSAASSASSNNNNSNNSSNSNSSNNVTSASSQVGGIDEEGGHPVNNDNDTDTEPDFDNSASADNDGDSDEDGDEENVDSGDLSDSSDASHRPSSHGNSSSGSTLAAYDIDVLESDGELDAEMRGRVEEVLLEYTMVMEAKSDADLRNRRLKYFNCLLDTNGAEAAAGEPGLTAPPGRAASVATSTASTQTSCSPLSPLTRPSVSSVSVDVVADAEDVGGPHSPLTLRLRLKYFNDNQRTVFASPVETIASFKRKHFAAELSQNQSVRLIYNGRELKEGENRGLTLASYALPQDATIHCLVLDAPPPPSPQTSSLTSSSSSQAAQPSATAATTMPSAASIEDFAHLQHGDIGGYMFPLFLAILALIWYCRVYYRAYFNFLSTMAMCAATLLLCAAIVAAFFSSGDSSGSGGGQIRVHRINLDSQATTAGAQRGQQRRDASSMTG